MHRLALEASQHCELVDENCAELTQGQKFRPKGGKFWPYFKLHEIHLKNSSYNRSDQSQC
jgi:hypothetical protein